MITAIDTNILLDLLIPDAPHAASSEALLDEAYQQGALIISEIVYAELVAQFPSQAELHRFLQSTSVRLEHSRPEALHAPVKPGQLTLPAAAQDCNALDADGRRRKTAQLAVLP